MIRIMTADEPDYTTVTVEGKLCGEYLTPLEACCDEAVGLGKQVRLFLRDVSNIDAAGHKLLQRLAAQGIGITATGLYTSYVVQSISAHATAE